MRSNLKGMYHNKQILKILANLSFISRSGVMNGVAMWVDWHLDDSSQNVITTGPIEQPEFNKEIRWDMYTRQGVFIFEENVNITEKDYFSTYVTCSELLDTIEFRFYLNGIKI